MMAKGLIALSILLAQCPGHAWGREPESRPAGEAVRALVEAEWIEEDRLFSPTAYCLTHTDRILDRAERLLERISPGAQAQEMEPLGARLLGLRERRSRLGKDETVPERDRRDLHFDARRLLRETAFSNPLLRIDGILFLLRHDAGGVYHMCDQFYGFNARPGGGLRVLRDPFGPQPRVADIIEGTLVEEGRLAGQSLQGGAFLSPELSYNGAIASGVHGGSRTEPGAFGARASPLLKFLGKEHYGVSLPGDDFRRFALWLDANSEFFGCYEDTAAQSRGEVVMPGLH